MEVKVTACYLATLFPHYSYTKLFNRVNNTFSIGEGYKPNMAVVVVQKRISTRIFGKESNGYDNPPPGTIIW